MVFPRGGSYINQIHKENESFIPNNGSGRKNTNYALKLEYRPMQVNVNIHKGENGLAYTVYLFLTQKCIQVRVATYVLLNYCTLHYKACNKTLLLHFLSNNKPFQGLSRIKLYPGFSYQYISYDLFLRDDRSRLS